MLFVVQLWDPVKKRRKTVCPDKQHTFSLTPAHDLPKGKARIPVC